MAPSGLSPRLLAEVLFAAFLILASAALLFVATDLPAMSALLPVAMLVALIVLCAVLIVAQTIRRDSLKTLPVEKVGRVIGGFAAIFVYAIAVDVVGFYTATLIGLPVTAWIFGFRKPIGLLAGTAIFVGAIYVIFSLGMSQRFPAEIWFN
ncbi:tripartite tricarboxylate transporter TctB family protein [Jiella avicenniae]|uniref:Tripartite tricarboxylate transporter TctB family protein n=1 Tax=Jiella avicenniae TaxID=2907202 RepID=A0A9X1T5I9_9HYPH|nr:tripartite tricarboxylate transporter TctB family protein [Jiella avicenniae]MCE7029621.1 tripartite tricarboxylate transporter TctB family protein [Jiella avicenniae]